MFEDNHFDMPPGQKRMIAVVHAAGGRQIIVKALNADPICLDKGDTQTTFSTKGPAL